MNRNLKTSNITEAAMISGILVIFAYISSFLFSFVAFFYPMPAIILAKRKGLKYCVLSLTAAGLIITMLLGIQTGIVFLILFSPIAIALSYGISRDENPNKTILMGSAAFMISFVIMILMMQAIMGVNYIQEMVEIYDESFDLIKEMLIKTAGDTNSQSFDSYIKNIDEMSTLMTYFISQLFPAILIISSVAMSVINYFMASKFSKRFKINIRQHEGLSYFSFPRTFIIAMAALLLISYALTYLNINANTIQMNLIMISYMAMFVQGFAVLKYFLLRININRVFRTLILLSAFLMGGVAQILVLVGIIDLIADLRKIRHRAV